MDVKLVTAYVWLGPYTDCFLNQFKHK